MSDNDLIRRGDALKALDWGDIYGRNAQDAIDALPAAQPTVKPLVWVETLDGGETCLTDERYSISYWEGEKLFVDRYTTMRRHPTLEAAKAAAQADYEARILSALDLQPTVSPKQLAARPDDVEALLEDFSAVLRYVPDSVVECRGDKCREPWCASCCGWDDAEEAIAVAHEAGKRARAALARVKGVM